MQIDILCNNSGVPKIKVTKEPLNGSVDVDVIQDYPGFEDSSPKVKCNEKKLDVLGLFYNSDRRFVGEDYFSIIVFYKNGAVSSYDYKVLVK